MIMQESAKEGKRYLLVSHVEVEVLDRNAARIERKLGDEPEIQARLMQSMGDLYESLGLLREAEPLVEAALDSRRALLGEDHPDTLTTEMNLVVLLVRAERAAVPGFAQALLIPAPAHRLFEGA